MSEITALGVMGLARRSLGDSDGAEVAADEAREGVPEVLRRPSGGARAGGRGRGGAPGGRTVGARRGPGRSAGGVSHLEVRAGVALGRPRAFAPAGQSTWRSRRGRPARSGWRSVPATPPGNSVSPGRGPRVRGAGATGRSVGSGPAAEGRPRPGPVRRVRGRLRARPVRRAGRGRRGGLSHAGPGEPARERSGEPEALTERDLPGAERCQEAGLSGQHGTAAGDDRDDGLPAGAELDVGGVREHDIGGAAGGKRAELGVAKRAAGNAGHRVPAGSLGKPRSAKLARSSRRSPAPDMGESDPRPSGIPAAASIAASGGWP